MGFKPKRAIDTEITINSQIPIFPYNRIAWCYTRKYLNFPANLHVTKKILLNHHKFVLIPVELPL